MSFHLYRHGFFLYAFGDGFAQLLGGFAFLDTGIDLKSKLLFKRQCDY
ncbi:MAG: hypothetical protein J6T88_09030 [Bacteroidales bacterium]|nr:hypothetical protein [Bacteroidales bacterium]